MISLRHLGLQRVEERRGKSPWDNARPLACPLPDFPFLVSYTLDSLANRSQRCYKDQVVLITDV